MAKAAMSAGLTVDLPSSSWRVSRTLNVTFDVVGALCSAMTDILLPLTTLNKTESVLVPVLRDCQNLN